MRTERILLYVLIGFYIGLNYSCSDDTVFPVEPEIEFISQSKNVLLQDIVPDTDSILIVIKFRDGDADFGFSNTDTSRVYLRDSRTNLEQSFRIPDIQASGTKGIEGEITIKTGSLCCIYPDGDIPCSLRTDYARDTMIYEIYVTDLAGNQSNVVSSDAIYIICDQ
jgi:hypothetical protein